jgi:carboxylesterase
VVEMLGIACMGPLLPGHGTSVQSLARTSHEQWLAAVVESYDALAATHERVYVMGFSLGGILALALCAERPVSAALLLAAPIDLGLRRRTLVRCLSPFVSTIPRIPWMVDREARSRDAGYRRMPLRSVAQLIELQRRVVARLPGIRVPLRLLYSRRDWTVDSRDAARIARMASAAEVEVQYLERSGHFLLLDLERDRTAAWVVEQLSALERPYRCG